MIQTKHLLVGVAVVFLSSCAANRQRDIIESTGQPGMRSSVESREDKPLRKTINDLRDLEVISKTRERRLRRWSGAPPDVQQGAELARESVCSDETFQNALLSLQGVIKQRMESFGKEAEWYAFWLRSTPAKAFNIDPQTLEGWPDSEVPESK
jgi:hypothetical protein